MRDIVSQVKKTFSSGGTLLNVEVLNRYIHTNYHNYSKLQFHRCIGYRWIYSTPLAKCVIN